MKNYIKSIITIIIIAVLSCNAVYAAEYIEGIEYNSLNLRQGTHWSGKEWITDNYPPRISNDGVNFTDVIENVETKSVLGDNDYRYVWTGNDYLAYHTNQSYYFYKRPKKLYRISADFDTVLNVYEIPNWITDIDFYEDKVYIATRDVFPNSDGKKVWGIRHVDYAVYSSSDFTNWEKFDYGGIDEAYSVFNINGNLIVDDYLYSDGNVSKILHEDNLGWRPYKTGDYLCQIVYKDDRKNEENSILAFSNDGIYWVKMITDSIDYIAPEIFETDKEFIINSSVCPFRSYNKEDIYSQLREKLPQNPVYVKLDGNYLGFEQPPVIENGRTLVPMRFIFEQMGAEVDWKGETRTVTATKDGMTVTLTIDDTNATVNGEAATLDVPARLINDKTMIPLRFLSENLGYTVDWDNNERTASIISEFPEIPLDGRQYYVIYREGYRDNRIELAVFDADNALIMDGNVLGTDGYTNDIKYYLDGDKWVEFERGYERVSNNTTEVIESNIDIINTAQ